MEEQKAWELVKVACSKVVGNLADHQAIQQAVLVLEKKLVAPVQSSPEVADAAVQ